MSNTTIMPTPASIPTSKTQHLSFFALYREYTARFISIPPAPPIPKSDRLSIPDICILMGLQSQCLLTAKVKDKKSNDPLDGYCQQSLSFFENKFHLSQSTVWRSIDKLQRLNLITYYKDNTHAKTEAPFITLKTDFSKSTTLVTAQNYNIADEYSEKSEYIKIFANTLDPAYINGRDLSITDILIYNIIYSFNYNNKHNPEHIFTRPISDIGMYLPCDNSTIQRSINNLKYYDLIQKISIPGQKKGTGNAITIKEDMITQPAEEFFDF